MRWACTRHAAAWKEEFSFLSFLVRLYSGWDWATLGEEGKVAFEAIYVLFLSKSTKEEDFDSLSCLGGAWAYGIYHSGRR